jgi:glucose-6-phosphate 1-dehydrogenase
VFAPTITALGRAGLHKSRGWVRLVVEKPFGRDRASARELNQTIHAEFSESQVYRIDHYLGKETVQNLLVFRFANAIFESVWNRDRVDHVQITVAEDLGIGTRGRYYETAGALRDMVQNHLTQLVTLVCMEIPATFDANEVHNEKAKVLRSLAPIEKEDVVFGQYTGGRSGGQDVPGYQKEKGVDPVSSIETFAALKLEVANWRWHGVPFYIRTGKRLTRRVSQIVVAFQRPPVSIFRHVVGKESDPNLLAITIQPDDGFDLAFGVKVPGEPIAIAQQSLRFRYAEKFPHVPDAYETLLLDILVGDQTLFNRADLVDESWRIYERVLESPPSVEPYAAGSWGPSGAEDLVARGGRRWLLM